MLKFCNICEILLYKDYENVILCSGCFKDFKSNSSNFNLDYDLYVNHVYIDSESYMNQNNPLNIFMININECCEVCNIKDINTYDVCINCFNNLKNTITLKIKMTKLETEITKLESENELLKNKISIMDIDLKDMSLKLSTYTANLYISASDVLNPKTNEPYYIVTYQNVYDNKPNYVLYTCKQDTKTIEAIIYALSRYHYYTDNHNNNYYGLALESLIKFIEAFISIIPSF